jgi:drug/metabolite transporter (DMT)-like permease
MSTSVRLASPGTGTADVVFFRALFGFVFALPLLARAGRGLLRIRYPRLYLLRCSTGAASMYFGFWGIAHLPLATAVALSYSAPVFGTCFARWIFRERVDATRWLAVLSGFVGIVLIAKPQGLGKAGVMAALASAMLTALSSFQVRRLAGLESPERIVFWSNAVWLVTLLPPAVPGWQAPHGGWQWLVLAGACGTGAQFLWARALSGADVSTVMPLSYAQMPFVALVGYVAFAELPDAWTLVGVSAIAGSVMLIVRSGSRRPEIKLESPR